MPKILRRGERCSPEPYRADETLDGLADRCVIVDHGNQRDLGHADLSWLPKSLQDFRGRHPGWSQWARHQSSLPVSMTARGGLEPGLVSSSGELLFLGKDTGCEAGNLSYLGIGGLIPGVGEAEFFGH